MMKYSQPQREIIDGITYWFVAIYFGEFMYMNDVLIFSVC
jgi:hypothetical protein